MYENTYTKRNTKGRQTPTQLVTIEFNH